MTRWEVSFRLSNRFSRIELDYWPNLFDSPACKVTRKEDGLYCLTACRFESLRDKNKVRESAKRLITMLIAFDKIIYGNDFRRIEHDDEDITVGITDFEDNNRKTHYHVLGKAITSYESVGRGTVQLLDDDGNVVRQERWYDYVLNRCDEEINRDVLDALFYFAEDATWYSLWKVFETVALDINSDSGPKAKRLIDKYGWADEDKLDDFGYWAQYYDAVCKHAGCGSRHSLALRRAARYGPKKKLKRKLKRARKPRVMELQKAAQLIGHLLEQWIEAKRPETMTFYCFSFLNSSKCMKVVHEYLNRSK